MTTPVPPPPPAPTPTDPHGAGTQDRRATWALALAVLPLVVTWVASLVLAVLVLTSPRTDHPRGRGLAATAIAVVCAWCVIGIGASAALVVTGDDEASPTVAAEREEPKDDSDDEDAAPAATPEPSAEPTTEDKLTTDLAVGDCVTDLDDGMTRAARTQPVVPCDQPHHAEVYHSFDLADGKWPGDSAIEEEAERVCFEQFETFTGGSYDDSPHDFTFYYPVRFSWPEDREVICVIYAFDMVSGTLANAGAGSV